VTHVIHIVEYISPAARHVTFYISVLEIFLLGYIRSFYCFPASFCDIYL